MRSYAARYHDYEKRHNHNTFNRTYAHRLEDHEIVLREIFNTSNHSVRALTALRALLFPHDGVSTAMFIDIGPGIANKDLRTEKGHGKPAITLQDLADIFPFIPVVALDLPSEVKIFTGETPASIAGYTIEEDARQSLLFRSNVHIVSGDGLKSLKAQWEDTSTNPYPERARPAITPDTTIFVRAANSIDIYCDWDTEVRPALEQLARDFVNQPVCYFFNREIIVKPAGSMQWTIVGRVSNMGFNHANRAHDRHGEPYCMLSEPKLLTLREEAERRASGVTTFRGVRGAGAGARAM